MFKQNSSGESESESENERKNQKIVIVFDSLALDTAHTHTDREYSWLVGLKCAEQTTDGVFQCE